MENDHIPRFDCDAARGLLPGYVDGELTETQAAPLREHLLACVTCRSGAVDQKNVSRWFEAKPVDAGVDASGVFQPGLVPNGFAARVARRAFAGDPGNLSVSQAAGASDAPYGVDVRLDREAPVYELLPFVLRLTAAAAVLVFGLSLLLRDTTLPENRDLQAYDSIPPWELERVEPVARPDLPAISADAVDETGVGSTADGVSNGGVSNGGASSGGASSGGLRQQAQASGRAGK